MSTGDVKAVTCTTVDPSDMKAVRADRVKGALYGLLIADALAAPTHWYYGGPRQIVGDYGRPITGYVKPVTILQGSLMGKSNTGGAGRGSDRGTIIGTTINHGKKQYWKSGSQYHYHVTLDAGDNTLEARLARRVIHILGQSPELKLGDVRTEYVRFMTTPGSHNDAYASTAHRMFFKNMLAGRPLEQCPDNDQHNVDTTDAITMTIPVGLFAADTKTAMANASQAVGLTRDSQISAQLAGVFTQMLRRVVMGESVTDVAADIAAAMRYDVVADVRRSRGDPLTA